MTTSGLLWLQRQHTGVGAEDMTRRAGLVSEPMRAYVGERLEHRISVLLLPLLRLQLRVLFLLLEAERIAALRYGDRQREAARPEYRGWRRRRGRHAARRRSGYVATCGSGRRPRSPSSPAAAAPAEDLPAAASHRSPRAWQHSPPLALLRDSLLSTPPR